ncbi:hypothetical protein NE237_020522 [Protea cynaroides]|uniref:Asparagine synthetase domain-containing protein 1 n=1 Tax=Protea cynaroides TaxID=273540 RepID=A0A9Q0HAQ9_9MAGN|nr:hypothetical protein NE237_020522 [Protea cynaroides]
MITNPAEKEFQTKKEGNTNENEMIKASSSSRGPWSGLRDPRIVRVSRSFGGKDRHSKVCTIRGLRDRRIRLSVPTAIQLYDLQDRLGVNQPSKVVDWLLNAAKHEIDELPPLQMPVGNFDHQYQQLTRVSQEFDATQSSLAPIVDTNVDYAKVDEDPHSLSSRKRGLNINDDVAREDQNSLYKSPFWTSRMKSKEVAKDTIADKINWMKKNEQDNQERTEGPKANSSSASGFVNNAIPYNSYYHWEPSNLFFFLLENSYGPRVEVKSRSEFRFQRKKTNKMCGIALIISGVRFDLSLLLPDYRPPPETDEVDQTELSVDDLKAALLRRGPDNLGSKKLFLLLKSSSLVEELALLSHPLLDKVIKREKSCLCSSGKNNICIVSSNEVSCTQDNHFTAMKSVAELHFLGATLQLRGINPVFQPLVDTSGNVLVYNGEIFGGIEVGSDSNDSEILMDALGRCCSCDCDASERGCSSTGKVLSSVPELLSTIKGPWALIYWQDSSKTMWFGRDALGRRSLLVHWPTLDDSRLLLSSVSPLSLIKNDIDFESEGLNFWEELPCGIYSVCFDASKASRFLVGTARKHEWTDPGLKELIKWDRAFVRPQGEELKLCNLAVVEDQSVMNSTSQDGMLSELSSPHIVEQAKLRPAVIQHSVPLPVFKVLNALRESVIRRTAQNKIFQRTVLESRGKNVAPVAVLFSGGLDSMILAALLDKCIDPIYKIDLLNVSFDGQSAPDRISARAGVKELQRNAPMRRWNLVEVDADLSDLGSEIKCVMSLIFPANTYMDLNIGIALWLAAGGDGWVDEGISINHEEDHRRIKYKSEAKILLVGSGADEQCAGYGRHKTKYRLGGWPGLHEEMRLDMQRIWKRNLGRDDRCISDNGKEARFPFLDEDVIRTLLDIPLWEVADLDQPLGKGDKKILREVARLLGLEEVSSLPKRAIQFGSRIARESNRKNFGSNRAANQASAGSVVIHKRTGAT